MQCADSLKVHLRAFVPWCLCGSINFYLAAAAAFTQRSDTQNAGVEIRAQLIK